MRYIRKFNESKSDIDFHLEQIEDLFMDVVDEFGIDRYDTLNRSGGIFYDIMKWNSSREYQIRLWIAYISTDGHITIGRNIVESDVLKNFENRLKNIGYTFTRSTDVQYYEIILSYQYI